MDSYADTFACVRGLEYQFIDAQEGAAFLRINTPDTSIMAIEIFQPHRNRVAVAMLQPNNVSKWLKFTFTLYLKADATFEQQDELATALDEPLQGSSGKTFIHNKPIMITKIPIYTNYYWSRMFAKQSKEFTPFESETRHVIITIENVDNDDIPDVITALISIVGLIRDDVDTKPARVC